MKRLILIALCAAFSAAGPATAQDKGADTNMQILRDKVKADKKVVVAANMELADAEGKKFWPVYDHYQKDLQGVNERLGALIVNYADVYKKGAVSNEAAQKLIHESVALDQAELKLKQTYAPQFVKAVGAVKAARYLQIENKIRAVIKYELAKEIPLVQ
ncbi:MAG: hypothetical protein ACREUW_10805 [Burkholderiales bacterium]